MTEEEAKDLKTGELIRSIQYRTVLEVDSVQEKGVTLYPINDHSHKGFFDWLMILEKFELLQPKGKPNDQR